MKNLKNERLGMERKNKYGELLKVIEYTNANNIIIEFQDKYKGQLKTQWQSFIKGTLLNPNAKLLGIMYPNTNFIDLTGQIFGRLTVLKRAENRGKRTRWECECSCEQHNHVIVDSQSLKSGHTKSCGCLMLEIASEKAKKQLNTKKHDNIYDLSGEYGIGYCINTNHPFYFDKDDFELISKYAWSQKGDYVITSTFQNNNNISMHRLVMKVNDPSIHIDHIGHNTFDNRKSKLRISTKNGNHQNLKIAKNNTSGVTGVCWEEKSQKWHSYIWHDNHCEHLGRFKDKNEAIRVRKEAEDKYFGEYSYDNSMKIYEDKNEL